MYYKLPIKERMELMKSYRKANPDMSYRDMVNDYNNSYKKFEDGGKSNGMTGMMKAKIATEAHYGNPAALRMVSPNPKTGMTPKGIGTHYMVSMDEYAVPLLQDKGGKNLEYIENPPISKEDIRFNSPEEAQYFAEHYKEVAPMMRNFQQHKYGGIQKFGNGGVKERDPIYVTDKNDPRLRAYSDSLSTYTLSKKAEKLFDKDFLDPKLQEYNQKADKAAKRSNIKPVTIKTSNSEFSAKGFDPGGMQEVWMAKFKKPVQPYVYKKPEEVLPQVTPQIVPQIPTQNIKPVIQDTVKYQPVIDNGLIRRWNFNTSNPTLEYYDKSGKLIKSEYYKNMNDFKQGKQINYK